MKKFKKILNTYRVEPSTNWNNVSNFANMWWFLPGEPWILNEMQNHEKDRLIELCLDTIWRKSDELQYSLWIENIQRELLKIPRIKKYIETWDYSLWVKDL